MLKGRSHDDYVVGARRVGPYLTLRRGIRYEQENVEWLKEAIDAITHRLDSRANGRASASAPVPG